MRFLLCLRIVFAIGRFCIALVGSDTFNIVCIHMILIIACSYDVVYERKSSVGVCAYVFKTLVVSSDIEYSLLQCNGSRSSVAAVWKK